MNLSHFARLRPLVLAGLVACAPTRDAPDERARTEPSAEVEAVLAEQTRAMNEGDGERVLSFYRRTPDFVYVGCTDLIVGAATFETLVRPYYDREPPESFVREIVGVHLPTPEVAVVSMRGRSTSAPALFWTVVLAREGGEWLIVHEHESWPACASPRPPHPFTSQADSTDADPGP